MSEILRRTSENSVRAKFAVFNFSALGRSSFDCAAPAQTRAHRPDGQCQRIRQRHLLYPATTCSTPMPGRRLWDSLLLTKPSTFVSGTFHFYGICRKNEEPTSGLEPLTCSLRVNCSYWTILCFILLDNRRYQRERRSVMQCNERLAVRAAPIPYRGLGIALRFTSRSYNRRADKRTRTADLISLQ